MWNDKLYEKLWGVLGLTLIIGLVAPLALFCLAIIAAFLMVYPWVAAYISICVTLAALIIFRKEIKAKYNEYFR